MIVRTAPRGDHATLRMPARAGRLRGARAPRPQAAPCTDSFATPGRYTVRLTVRNGHGQASTFGREVFVRGPDTTTVNGGAVPCPARGSRRR